MKPKSVSQTAAKRARIARWARHLTQFDSEVFSRHVADKKPETALLAKAGKQNFRGLTQAESFKIEAIVLKSGRPVLVVKNDTVAGDGAGEEWARRLADAAGFLQATLPSIGRIEMRGAALNAARTEFSDQMIGTGFVVARNLVLTNRHVAEVFCLDDGRVRPELDPRIDFVEEYERDPDVEFKIVRALEIGTDYDYALLEVEGAGSFPSPLNLSGSMPAMSDFSLVFSVGYPAFDTRNPTDVQKDVFGSLFEVKRLAPGRLRQVVREGDLTLLEGDYTTLGGNSGSPLIDFETGEVVALHFAGAYLEGNYSVPMSVLKPRIERVKQRVGGERASGQPSGVVLESVMQRLTALETALRMTGSVVRAAAETPEARYARTVAQLIALIERLGGRQPVKPETTIADTGVDPVLLRTCINEEFVPSPRLLFDAISPANNVSRVALNIIFHQDQA